MRRINKKSVVLAVICCLVAGCSRSNAPRAMTDAEFSSGLSKGFEKSKAENKQLIQQATSSFEKKEYIAANSSISSVLSKPDLSAEERAVASQALINLNQKIRAAAENGDQMAQQLQQMQAARK